MAARRGNVLVWLGIVIAANALLRMRGFVALPRADFGRVYLYTSSFALHINGRDRGVTRTASLGSLPSPAPHPAVDWLPRVRIAVLDQIGRGDRHVPHRNEQTAYLAVNTPRAAITATPDRPE
jgi:hypothetical protein